MQVRAAVLEEFGQPLAVQDVELDEPEAGEALVRLVACGVCHTDLYTASGADPSCSCRACLATRARCRRGRRRRGDARRRRRPRHHALRSRVRPVRPLPERTGRTAASRSAASRALACAPTARRDSAGRTMAEALHGHSTFAEYTVMPEIALAKVSPEAPLEGCAPSRSGSRPASAPRSSPRSSRRLGLRRFRLRPRGPRRRNRLLHGGGRPHHRRRPLGGQARGGRRHGATDTMVAAEGTVDWIRSETGGSGADYTFEATGNVAVIAQAVEAAREAWGLATMCWGAGKGESSTSSTPAHHGPRVTGSSFGGVKGRTTCRSSSTVACRRDRLLVADRAPAHARRREPRLELMEARTASAA